MESGGEAPRKFLSGHALQTLGKHGHRPVSILFWLEDLALKIVSGSTFASSQSYCIQASAFQSVVRSCPRQQNFHCLLIWHCQKSSLHRLLYSVNHNLVL